jgi:hypothetical protein
MTTTAAAINATYDGKRPGLVENRANATGYTSCCHRSVSAVKVFSGNCHHHHPATTTEIEHDCSVSAVMVFSSYYHHPLSATIQGMYIIKFMWRVQ